MKTILRHGRLSLTFLCSAVILAWAVCLERLCAAPAGDGSLCAAPPTNMVAWWPLFNGNDSVGTADLTAHNYAGFGGGIVKSGAWFLTNSYFTAFGTNLDIGAGDGMTFEGWISPRTLSEQQAIVEWNNGSGKVGASVFISIASLGGPGSIFVNLPGTNGVDHYWATSPNVLSAGVWQHIAVTYHRASGYGRIYLNGTNVASSHLGSFTPQTKYQFNVGRRASGAGAGSYFQGEMDELSLYSRALTDEEIRSIYLAGADGKCPPSSLAPVIIQHPWDQTVGQGETIRFKAIATGEQPLLYQWFKNGEYLQFTEDSLLEITNAQPNHAGVYSAIVMNNYGRATSSVARLTVTSSSNAPCAGFPPSVVAWWPMDIHGVDLMGYDTASFHPGATIASGLVSNSLYLPGGNSYARVYGSTRWALRDAITVEAWVKPTVAKTQIILSKWRGANGYGDNSWRLGVDIGGTPFFTISKDGVNTAAVAVGANTAPVNEWSHVAGTYDGSHIRVYVNGVLGQSLPYSGGIWVGGSHIGIGASLGATVTNTPADHFTGYIDEPAVYATALSPETLRQIVTAAGNGKCKASLAPVFTVHPADTVAPADSWVRLSAELWGAQMMSYRWLKDGNPLPRNAGYSLDFPSLSATDQGRYTLVVSNRYGEAVSSNALLTVTPTTNQCGIFGVTPVAWWPADGDAVNLKTGVSGELYNGATYANAKVLQGFDLNGNGAHVRVPSFNIPVRTNLTIEVWVYPTQHRQQTIVSKWNGSGATNYNTFDFYLRADGTPAFKMSGNGNSVSAIVAGTNALPLHAWTHLAVTYDGVTLFLLVNGEQLFYQTFQGAIAWGDAELGIGAQVGRLAPGEYNAPFSGIIDELTFFPHNLDRSEIKYFYERGSAGKCLERGAPMIVYAPAPVTVGAGQPFSLSVTAMGSPPLSYQWFRGAELINGARSNVFSLQEAMISDQGFYLVQVSNVYGRTTSAAAFVRVTNTPPRITHHPAPVSVAIGQSASFEVTAVGGAPMTYRWRKDNITIPGATNRALIIPSVSAQDAGIYTVQVGNSLGVVFSSPAALTITNPPSCAPISASALHWWRGDTNLLDSIGDLYGWSTGVSYVQGKVGPAIYFDGAYDTITNVVPGLTNILDNYTIELWARPVAGRVHTPETAEGIYGISGQRYAVFPMNGAYGNVGSGISIGTNGISVFEHGAAYLSSLLVYATDIKDWVHVAVVYTNRQPSLYVNGQWVRTGLRSSRSSYPSTWLGGNSTTPQDYGHYVGSLDEVTIYKEALTPAHIQEIYLAGSLGKCPRPEALQPVITVPPTNLLASQGQSVTFSVIATGAPPLSYQWYLGTTSLAGARSSTFTLTNVQPQFSGPYSVWVTNAFGKASATANLAVSTQQTLVRILDVTNIAAGQSFSVPIELVASGIENALTFTVVFPEDLVRFEGLAVSSSLGGARMFNTNYVATGRLGVGLALEPERTFAAGTSIVATLQMVASPFVLTNVATTVGFTDDLAKRQVADVLGNEMNAAFLYGRVNLVTGYEADVAPRPLGDTLVTSTDWVVIGRMAVGRAIPSSHIDFLKADCAPRSTLGDGLITVSDWVQAGRYASGIDPRTHLGGPSRTGFVATAKQSVQGARVVKATSAGLKPGSEGQVLIHLQAQGGENAFGFSLRFDPSVLTFGKAALLDPMATGVLEVNDVDAASGKVGIVAALPAGQTLEPGISPVVRLTFKAAPSAETTALLSFADTPVIREVASAEGESLSATYDPAVVQVSPRPLLRIHAVGNRLVLRWPAWAVGARLESSQGPTALEWQPTSVTPSLMGDEMAAELPAPSQSVFYRLRQP